MTRFLHHFPFSKTTYTIIPLSCLACKGFKSKRGTSLHLENKVGSPKWRTTCLKPNRMQLGCENPLNLQGLSLQTWPPWFLLAISFFKLQIEMNSYQAQVWGVTPCIEFSFTTKILTNEVILKRKRVVGRGKDETRRGVSGEVWIKAKSSWWRKLYLSQSCSIEERRVRRRVERNEDEWWSKPRQDPNSRVYKVRRESDWVLSGSQ